MLTAANITMQFGAKPLFENISVKFGDGNRYGLIGANGCGKSTLIRILGGDLEPSGGNVALDPHERLGKLEQDQFAYEDVRVLDVVLMGHREMWQVKQDKDAIYANPDATEEDYVRAAELESTFAEQDGYTAEARAGELLQGIGIAQALHDGPMSAVAPGWKLRVLLAQALFANPDILLLDEPTNNLDINSIRWLEDVLNERVEHDDHHLARPPLPEQRLHAHGRPRLRQPARLSRQLRRLHDRVDAGARAAALREREGEGEDRRPAGIRAPLLGQQVEGAAGDLARAPDREDQARGREAVVAAESVSPLRGRSEAEAPSPRGRDRAPRQGLAGPAARAVRRA